MNGKGLRIPSATYRLQFNAGFTFSDAAEIIPYLHSLGISDIYASPYLKARKGSLHGYDILDQNSLNPEIGTEHDYDALITALHQHAMGQIADIVPNHMCIEGQGNDFWMDVLENGPSSACACFFDIDWHPIKQELENRILVPILGDQYGTVLENGELKIAFEEGAFFVHYYDHKLPVIPKTYSKILTINIDALEQELSGSAPQFQELMSIITALKHLPFTTELDPERIAERYREKEVIKRRLLNLYQNSGAIKGFIDNNLKIFNGIKNDPRSYDLLDELLQDQVYRISHWRVATEEINYRRFFDINSLGAIKVENPAVFEKTHNFIFKLVETGKINGLRIDHADGLRDPEDYLKRLQAGCFIRMYKGSGESQPSGMDEESQTEAAIREKYDLILQATPSYKPFFIVGEKILLKSEKLPEDWPVFGTTGYDFINQVNGLFVDGSNAKVFESIYTRFMQHRVDFHAAVYDKKKLVMQVAMSSEINTLAHYLNRISEQNRHTRDFTLNSLIKSIVEVIANFPVYRTYTNSLEVSERDRQYIEMTILKAKRQNPAISSSVFDFIRDVLLLRFSDAMTDDQKQARLDFVMRFQQITGPIMAKGVEDTAFYLYNRLISLNEVGGSPERFGISPEAFHGQNIERCKNRPLAMLASSTHDTKRSEDVRARINVLSEIPEVWKEGLSRWSRQNRRVKMVVDGKPAPSRNEEYLLYQTMIGTWPFCKPDDEEFGLFRTRIKEYMLKAMREAKVHTSWINPNSLREDAVMYFIDTILKDSPNNQFLHDFGAFQAVTAAGGIVNALSQTLLKITSPGIPDIYQGNELWDFSLVAPDNRRPVDYTARKRYLDELIHRESAAGLLETAREVVGNRSDGRIKLHLTWKALTFRRANRELFESGRYLPLTVAGVFQEQVCAFERSINNRSILVVVPRLCTRLMSDDNRLPLGAAVWQDTRLLLPLDTEASSYRNIFTGELLLLNQHEGQLSLNLADILAEFPCALLERFDRICEMPEPASD
ncbi:malto-oligosyltrehalose synthase [Trichlorobacter lovleyi]|uniref:malto-oligosyltrehalose synthase n=1 Tax=Trichlorobacter lovleyi TaxID=313985 RepID=UPI00223ED83B|nr:malto-oligosyltrehalose synthase [Trichlorobacter lovleyi]QOX78846.1 malto-oligosyltrehalose synthase [Trichlorobacter lovleyi]